MLVKCMISSKVKYLHNRSVPKDGNHHFILHSCFSIIYKCSLLTQIPPVQHVKHTSWRANDDVGSLRLEFLHFVPHVGASNAGMARSAHVVTQSQDNLLNLQSRQTDGVYDYLQVLTFGSQFTLNSKQVCTSMIS